MRPAKHQPSTGAIRHSQAANAGDSGVMFGEGERVSARGLNEGNLPTSLQHLGCGNGAIEWHQPTHQKTQKNHEFKAEFQRLQRFCHKNRSKHGK
jgi:hypothetical protein